MRTSRRGVRFICRHEGFRARPYKVGSFEEHWTIGYGHYGPDVKPGMTWSQRKAKRVLRRKDLPAYERAVRKLIRRALNQHEFDALVSFTYNLGAGALEDSTLRKRLNRGETKPGVFRDELRRWVMAGGEELPGLVARREDEIRLANKGEYR